MVGTCLVGCGSSGSGRLRGRRLRWRSARHLEHRPGLLRGRRHPTPACDGKLHDIISNVHESGTVTFNVDGTFRTFVTTVYDDARITPESCIEAAGSNCAIVTSDPGVCSLNGDNCVCKVFALTSPDEQRGTYTVSGSQVTLTLTTEKGMNTWDFCAQGSGLHLHMAHGFGISVLDRGMDIEADVLLTR